MNSEPENLRRIYEAALPTGVLADTALINQHYRRNVTALERSVSLVLRPQTERDIERIVALANEHRTPLYPFSTGRNWGLGSKLPVLDGCVLVDLSAMNRIIEISGEFAYAIIEPGVTQAQLAAYLREHHPNLTMNFTGSFGHTGILGNVLERGDGGTARVDDLLGVRGILGNGKPFQAGGFWDQVGVGRPSHYSRFRAGPDLCGLFCQSNFGIITQMAFRLIHQPESRCIFYGTVSDENLERLVDAFDYLGGQGAINRGSVNIGYANRFVQASASMGKTGSGSSRREEAHFSGEMNESLITSAAQVRECSLWNFYVLLTGTARVTEAVVQELQTRITPLCQSAGVWRVNPNDDARAVLPEFLHPLAQPLAGFPDTESIKLIYHLTSTPLPARLSEIDVDQTPFGMKCCIPVIPPRGAYARQAAAIVSAMISRFGLNVKMSLFGDGRTLITIHFRTDDSEQVHRAEACESALWDALVAAGFPPYRVSIDQMSRLAPLEPGFFDLVSQLKSVLDPKNIISPGRYCRTELV